jgi:hypothetical protein
VGRAVTPEQHLSWLQQLVGKQQQIEVAGARAGANAANAGKRSRDQRILVGSNTVAVRGGRTVAVKRVTDAIERGVQEELGRVLQ